MKKMVCILILSVFFLTSCQGADILGKTVHATGDADYYYKNGWAESSYGTTDCLMYSREFVKKFENLSFNFNYFGGPISLPSCCRDYDFGIISITYSSENYNLAKEDLFANSNYFSDKPLYIYNGYELYRINLSDNRCKLFINAFHDENYTIVLMGVFDSNLDIPEEDEWPEFLRTYYSEYYDFDA